MCLVTFRIFNYRLFPVHVGLSGIFSTFATLNKKEMTEYEVTGITHRIGRGLPREDAKTAAHEFITALKPGTPLILMAEPSNTHDENAIAVYLDYTKHIGYIKSSRCLELKALLDENGQCDAVVSGNDGWITMFITIPDAPESLATSIKRECVLPPNPLEKELRMDFTDEEKALQVIAPRIIKMKVTEENIVTFLTLVEHYLPFATYSICYDDCVWRAQILGILRSACRLDVNAETKRRLEDLRDQLHEIEGDMTDRLCRRKLRLMEQQLQQLQGLAEAEDGLFVNFECHIANSGRRLKEELNKLDSWFRLMPHLNLRDYKIHEKLVEGLGYQRVSRKELYEVYASLLILSRYAREADAIETDFSEIKEYVGRVKDLLSADCQEKTYDELWDAILALPAVKAIAKKTGKQQNTTFNRNLIAHILHLMMNKGVFGTKTTNQAMAEALEGNKDHSVRDAVSKSMEDRVMKSAIDNLIEEKRQ